MNNEQLVEAIKWIQLNVIGSQMLVCDEFPLYKVTVLGKEYFVCGRDESDALDVLFDHLEETNNLISSGIFEGASSKDTIMYGECWNFKEEPVVELIYSVEEV